MADKKQNNKRNNRNNDEDYNPKFRKMRKKVCALCANKDLVLDYKNAEQLKKIKDYNLKFIIGSDAHIPQNVGNFELALDAVNKSGLNKSLIENILI